MKTFLESDWLRAMQFQCKKQRKVMQKEREKCKDLIREWGNVMG